MNSNAPVLIKSIEDYLDLLGEQFATLQSGIYAAAQMFVEACTAHPGFEAHFKERFPSINPHRIADYKRIGERSLLPELAENCSAGAAALRRLPVADQRRWLNEPIPVFLQHEGQSDTLLVALDDLTYEQARQVFDKDHVRSLGAQRAWLESRPKRLLAPRIVDAPYIIKGKQAVINGVSFDLKTLLQICAQMQS